MKWRKKINYRLGNIMYIVTMTMGLWIIWNGIHEQGMPFTTSLFGNANLGFQFCKLWGLWSLDVSAHGVSKDRVGLELLCSLFFVFHIRIMLVIEYPTSDRRQPWTEPVQRTAGSTAHLLLKGEKVPATSICLWLRSQSIETLVRKKPAQLGQ